MSIHLTPEVEQEIRAEAEARGISVDALLAAAVDSYSSRRPRPNGAKPAPYHDRRAEMTWAEKPDAEYRGKWVVLQGNAVIASGANPSEIYEQARSLGIDSPFLIYVPCEEPAPFVGGWLD